MVQYRWAALTIGRHAAKAWAEASPRQVHEYAARIAAGQARMNESSGNAILFDFGGEMTHHRVNIFASSAHAIGLFLIDADMI